MEMDIADYAKDGRLTEPSDGKRYEWRKMIDAGVNPIAGGYSECMTIYNI